MYSVVFLSFESGWNGRRDDHCVFFCFLWNKVRGKKKSAKKGGYKRGIIWPFIPYTFLTKTCTFSHCLFFFSLLLWSQTDVWISGCAQYALQPTWEESFLGLPTKDSPGTSFSSPVARLKTRDIGKEWVIHFHHLLVEREQREEERGTCYKRHVL